MLTPFNRSRFVEKVITDAHGREFKALFFVTLEGGKVIGRLVSVQPLAAEVLALNGSTPVTSSLCLTGFSAPASIETPYVASVAPFVSPYFDLDLFLSTQPTRAPAVSF